MARRNLIDKTDPVQRRAWAYVRVSTGMQAESGLSIDEQGVKVRARCVENGWQLEHVFVDAGVSGSTPIGKRPEGAMLLAAVRPGDVVVSARMDRMFRSAADALRVIEDFKRRRIGLWLLDLGNDCSGNGISELIVTILAAVAQFERSLISERTRDVKANMRRNGRHQGGKRPFGHQIIDGRLIPDPGEQAAIATMRRLRARGDSLMTIRDKIRAKGFAISHETVRGILAAREDEDAAA